MKISSELRRRSQRKKTKKEKKKEKIKSNQIKSNSSTISPPGPKSRENKERKRGDLTREEKLDY